MTKQKFYKENIENIENKLNNLKKLSFKDWFYTYARKEIIENKDLHSAELYDEFEELYFLKKDLNEKEIERRDYLYDLHNKFLQMDIESLERKIKFNKEQFEYFTEEENLDIETWFNKYYIKLMKNPKFLEERKLALEIVKKRIDEQEAYKNSNNHLDLKMSVFCLQNDYLRYQKEQLTKVTYYFKDLFMFPRENPSYIYIDV